jgi:hypothetical protein
VQCKTPALQGNPPLKMLWTNGNDAIGWHTALTPAGDHFDRLLHFRTARRRNPLYLAARRSRKLIGIYRKYFTVNSIVFATRKVQGGKGIGGPIQ